MSDLFHYSGRSSDAILGLSVAIAGTVIGGDSGESRIEIVGVKYVELEEIVGGH